MNNNVDTCKCALDGIENSKYIKGVFSPSNRRTYYNV